MKKFVLMVCLCAFMLPARAAQELPTIAVVDFESGGSSSGLGRQLAEYVIDGVVGTGLFAVVERSKMDTVFEEVGFSGSGAVSPQSAVNLGEMLGAQYLLTGQIIDIGENTKSVSSYGVQTNTTTYNLKASARIIETGSGRIVFSGRESASSSVQETGSMSVSGGSPFGSLAEQLADSLVQQIAATDHFTPKEEEEMEFVEVQFESDPADADVEVDGIFYGNAGSTIEVPAGLHDVKISLPGYEVWNKKVMFREGQSVKATLEEKADLKVKVEQERKVEQEQSQSE